VAWLDMVQCFSRCCQSAGVIWQMGC
jgi:hypothetical protein